MAIKKAELHTHLEGTITPQLAKQLAARNKLILPDNLITSDGLSYCYRDFFHFLEVYDLIAALIKHPRDYYDVTFDYLKELAEADTVYVELMYSPDHAEMVTGAPSSESLAAIQQAIDDAEHQFNIIARIIITAVRHFGVPSAIKVAKQALKENISCIVGFGLAGDEANYPPKLFSKAFSIAAEGTLGCTVHAGEVAPASGMMEAMDYLPIQRIGHGVNAIHCNETIARLKEKNIALEICLSSNISFGLFKDFSSHPLPRLKEAGIKISLGSDDPPFFRTNLANEYKRVQRSYQYSDAEMESFTAIAIETAFVDEQTKSKLRAKLTHHL